MKFILWQSEDGNIEIKWIQGIFYSKTDAAFKVISVCQTLNNQLTFFLIQYFHDVNKIFYILVVFKESWMNIGMQSFRLWYF